jgi:DNA-directed RNA polymerase specialized sigma24 family protein
MNKAFGGGGSGRISNKNLGQRVTPAGASPARAISTKVIVPPRQVPWTGAVGSSQASRAADVPPVVATQRLNFSDFTRLWTKGKQTLDAWRANGIPADTQKRIEWRARRLVAAYKLPKDTIGDIEQDFYIKVWSAIGVYKEGRAIPEAFASAVIELYYAYLVRQICTKRRREIEVVPLLDMLFEAPERFARDYGEQRATDLRLDIATVLDQLPEELHELGEVLKEKTPPEIASYIGVHRGTIYRWIKSLRDEFGGKFKEIY